MNVPSHWFTAPRVRRLQRLIGILPRRSPGIANGQLENELRPQLDGPREEIPLLVHIIAQLGLLHLDSGHYYLSNNGRRVLTLSEDRSRREVAKLLIQAGFLHDQVRQLVEASTIDKDGLSLSRIGLLRHSAPQLLGLLRAWPNIVGPSFVRIPPDLFAEIDTPWSLVPPPQTQKDTLEAVGQRAEAYSFHLLRLEADHPSSIVWVSRDDQSLGYDIEDRSLSGVRRVEVKGSQSKEVRFVITQHEHEVAHLDPSTYEVHFWGEINLTLSPNVEFTLLRERGFPLRFEDFAAHLVDHRLEAVPIRYRVTLGSGVLEDS